MENPSEEDIPGTPIGKKLTPERFHEILDSAFREDYYGEPPLSQVVLEGMVDDLAMHIMWAEDKIQDMIDRRNSGLSEKLTLDDLLIEPIPDGPEED